MLGVVGVVFIASGDRVTRLLGFAVPIYFIVMTSLHHEVHTVVVSELQLQERNDEANVQLREANAQLSQQALRDDLTGLANRPAFMARLDAAVAAARRDRTIDRRALPRHRPVQGHQRLARPRGRRHGARGGRGADHEHHSRRPTCSPGSAATSSRCCSTGARSRGGDRDRGARRRACSRRRSRSPAGGSTSRRASASRRTSIRPTTARRCSRTRTPRSTGRSKAAAIASRCSTSSCASRSSAGWATSRSSATRSPEATSSRGTSPRWTCAPDRSSARRRWPRWRHAERGMLDASQFVPLAEEAGLVFRLDDRIVTGVVEARAELALAGIDPTLPDLVQRVVRSADTRASQPNGSPRCCSTSGAIPARSGSRSPRPRSFPT